MQRALACAAMARGVSIIRNPTWCADSLAAMRVAEALGASIDRSDDLVTVRGGLAAAATAACEAVPGEAVSGEAASGEVPVIVSCGESGLCLRMFSAIAALSGRAVELRAEGSLAGRPVGMVVGPLRALGADCVTRDGLPPVRIRGPLLPGRVVVDGSESSQFVTGLLMALPMTGSPAGSPVGLPVGQVDAPTDTLQEPPMAGPGSVVVVERLASGGYVDLTLDIMRAFGAEVRRCGGPEGSGEPGQPGEAVAHGDRVEFRVAGRPYRPAEYEVEGDWSGAAFALVAGAIAAGPEGLEVSGLNLASSQPDRAIIDALRLAGARMAETAAACWIGPGRLHGFDFDATHCPDLFPPLVALASRCVGVTRLKGALRLRAKESDRAEALSAEFGKLGLAVTVDGDLMSVRGLSGSHPPAADRLRAGRVSSRGDHRIAMAVAVAALAGSGRVDIDGAESVGKSWPGFFEALDAIRLRDCPPPGP